MTLKSKKLSGLSLFAVLATGGVALLSTGGAALAADYSIDEVHSSVNFRIQHLGVSWLYGRFDSLKGTFSFDEENPADATIAVEIDTASVNSNLGERDNHLRSGDFLDVGNFPLASFESTSMEVEGESALVHGKLTLRGVTKDITINADYVGSGNDPWGGYRAGFVGTTSLPLADFGMTYNLGPASTSVEMTLNIEGIRN